MATVGKPVGDQVAYSHVQSYVTFHTNRRGCAPMLNAVCAKILEVRLDLATCFLLVAHQGSEHWAKLGSGAAHAVVVLFLCHRPPIPI